MQLKKGQIIDLEIDAIAFGGRGIGRFEGRAVFVDGVMPGDKVRASLTRIKEKFMEAELVELVAKSAERIEPRCKHFGTCGGCKFQFMKYEDQLGVKKQHVIDALERIGGLKGVRVKNPIGSESEFYYRNKMEFTFGYDGEMNFALGMHLPGRRYDILDLDICYLQSELSVEILNRVREFCLERGWKPRKFTNNEGFLRSLYIREGKRTGEVMVNFVTSQSEGVDNIPKGFVEELEKLADIFGESVSSFYWTNVISKRGQRKRFEEKLIRGKSCLSEIMKLDNGDELKFDILPQAFFQVNTYAAESLYSQVLKYALVEPCKVAFDLYCGTGTIGLFLAKHLEKVLGIESNEEAVKAAVKNAKANGVDHIEFFTGDTGKLLKDLKESPDVVVIDPPRAGVTAKVIEQIDQFSPKTLVYVSCNPTTLARDLRLLTDLGFQLKEVQPVDMFPQTYHIETVCLLQR